MQHLTFKKHRAWQIALLVTVTAGTLAPAHAGLFSISEKDEIKAGEQVRQQAYKEYGKPLPASHPMSQRVKALGAKFARLSARKNIPYSYTVIQNDKLLNAFAAPGGPIFVTTKLVKTTTNDAELAYVLGHETAHIDRKHIVKAVEKQQKVGLGVGILGTILGGKGGGDLVQVFGNVAFTVWTRGYSRDQETEADTVGARWMSQLGFDPRAAVSMLGRLGGTGGGGVDKYLSSHPAPKDRQAKVTKLIQDEKLLDVAKRNGGPRLAAADLPEYSYSNVSSNGNNGTYPDDDIISGEDGDGTLMALNAPLIMVQRGTYNVIMAPVGAFARWAGANVDVDEDNDNVTTVEHGRNFIRLRRNSTAAVVNGKNVTLSAPANVYNELLYAPLGSLAEGIGGKASLSDDNQTIILTRDGERFYAKVPNR